MINNSGGISDFAVMNRENHEREDRKHQENIDLMKENLELGHRLKDEDPTKLVELMNNFAKDSGIEKNPRIQFLLKGMLLLPKEKRAEALKDFYLQVDAEYKNKDSKEFYDELTKEIRDIEAKVEAKGAAPDGLEKYRKNAIKQLGEKLKQENLINETFLNKEQSADIQKNSLPGGINKLLGDYVGIFAQSIITAKDLQDASETLKKIEEECEKVEADKTLANGIKAVVGNIKKATQDSETKILDKTFEKTIKILNSDKIDRIAELRELEIDTIFGSIIKKIITGLKSFFLGIEEKDKLEMDNLKRKTTKLIDSIQRKDFKKIKADASEILRIIDDKIEEIGDDKNLDTDIRKAKIMELKEIKNNLTSLTKSNLKPIIDTTVASRLSAQMSLNKNGLPELYKIIFKGRNEDVLLLLQDKDNPSFYRRIEKLILEWQKAAAAGDANRANKFVAEANRLEIEQSKFNLLIDLVKAKSSKEKQDIEIAENNLKALYPAEFNEYKNYYKGALDEFGEFCEKEQLKQTANIVDGLDQKIEEIKRKLEQKELEMDAIAEADKDAINAENDKLIKLYERLKYITKDKEIIASIQEKIDANTKKKKDNEDLIDRIKEKEFNIIKEEYNKRSESIEEFIKKHRKINEGLYIGRSKAPNAGSLKDYFKGLLEKDEHHHHVHNS